MSKVGSFAAFVLLAAAAPAAAQMPSWSPEQTAVWNVVSQSWVDEVAKNGRWPSAYFHDRGVTWDSSYPFPRTKGSLERWVKFDQAQRQMLQYEIAPVAITVAGNTAVVHYTGVTVSQRAQDKPERERFGVSETLVRDGGEWKFLSSTGLEIGK